MSKKEFFAKSEQMNLKILFALMKTGCRSDRVIAKNLGISNSTISRRKRKLEQEGYIKEYTAIPDFHKIGIEFIVFSFATTTDVITQKHFEEVKEVSRSHPEILCILQEQDAIGVNFVVISAHRSYDSYLELAKNAKKDFQSHPSIKMRHFIFHTSTQFPAPFSLRSLESLLLQPEKQLHTVDNKSVDGKITPNT